MFSPGGVDWVSKQAALWQWAVNGSGLPNNQVVWAQQNAPRPVSPAIILRIANIAETGDTWQDWEPNPLTFTSISLTSMSAADTFAATAHGLLTGDGPVRLTGTLPSPLAAGTDYWIIAPDANHLKFAATYVNTGGGQGSSNPITPIAVTPATVTATLSQTTKTVRAGAELLAIARTYLRVTLELHCYSTDGAGLAMAQALLQRVRTRRYWQTQLDLLSDAGIGLIRAERIRAIQGIKDAVIFEPRAYLEVQFCISAEESEDITIITSADITDEITDRVIHISEDGQ